MKNLLMSIVLVTLASVSLSSQNSLPIKTTYNGKNAVIISESQMDSIAVTYLNFNLQLSKTDAFKLDIKRLMAEIDKSNVTVNYLENDNKNLSQIILKSKDRFENQSKLHEAELLYYKEKAKGKFTSFIYGTVAGALIVGVLTLL